MRSISAAAFTACLSMVLATRSSGIVMVDFEDKTLAQNSFYNGNHGTGTNSDGWDSGGAFFNNDYNASFGGFWSGWSYSNVQDATNAGFGNQYAAYTGSGVGGSGIYGISNGAGAYINLPAFESADSVRVTNATYAALSMKNGDAFAKKFGGQSGDDADFFSVIFTGFTGPDGSGTPTGFVERFLADYRFANDAQDYILDTWATLDLAALGDARSIKLSYTSSDVGGFGINTPLYVAIDNLSLVPEPASLGLVTGLCGILTLGRRRTTA